jgi:hypothetical protein
MLAAYPVILVTKTSTMLDGRSHPICKCCFSISKVSCRSCTIPANLCFASAAGWLVPPGHLISKLWMYTNEYKLKKDAHLRMWSIWHSARRLVHPGSRAFSTPLWMKDVMSLEYSIFHQSITSIGKKDSLPDRIRWCRQVSIGVKFRMTLPVSRSDWQRSVFVA